MLITSACFLPIYIIFAKFGFQDLFSFIPGVGRVSIDFRGNSLADNFIHWVHC